MWRKVRWMVLCVIVDVAYLCIFLTLVTFNVPNNYNSCLAMNVMFYQYTVLAANEIRLICLLPATYNEPLRVTFNTLVLEKWDRQPADKPGAWSSGAPPKPNTRYFAPSTDPNPQVQRPRSVRSKIAVLRANLKLPATKTLLELDNGDFVIRDISGDLKFIGDGSDYIREGDMLEHNPLLCNGARELAGSYGFTHYEALSFWHGLLPGGTPSSDANEYIYVALASDHAPLVVPSTLAQVLRRLRYKHNVRSLWLDLLCIKPLDDTERRRHTRMATRIYQQAERVIGVIEEPPTAHRSGLTAWQFSFLETICQHVDCTKGGIFLPHGAKGLEHLTGTLSKDVWDGFGMLLSSPFFARLWCWVEMGYGSKKSILMAGKHSILWIHFVRGIYVLSSKATAPFDFKVKCRWLLPQYHRDRPTSTQTLISLSASKYTTEPRDHVFALLTLFPEFFSSCLRVNYNMPAESVFTQVFFRQVNLTKQLQLLDFCDLGSPKPASWPSWLPNWSSGSSGFIRLPTDAESSAQLPSGITAACISYDISEPEVLGVAGVELSTIIAIGDRAPAGPTKTLTVLSKWALMVEAYDTYVTGYSMAEAFALTVVQNKTVERFPNHLLLNASGWRKVIGLLLQMNEATITDKKNQIYDDFSCKRILHGIRDKRFFMTKSGHIGIGVAALKEDDIICLIHGAHSPMILRPKKVSSWSFSKPNKDWIVVGPAYVHGLSDATTFLGPLPKGWHVEVLPDSRYGPVRLYIKTISETAQSFSPLAPPLRIPRPPRTIETLLDPRLPQLGDKGEGEWTKWEAVYEKEVYGDGDGRPPRRVVKYRLRKEWWQEENKNEVVDWHPYMLASSLRKRGQPLTIFRLV